MNYIYPWLSSIPAVIWSGVIASILTLSGVLISNKSNTKRLKIQLEHDAKQKSEDRKSIIKREVYLDLAKEATKATNYLAGIANIDIVKINISDGMKDYFIAANKLTLIAETKTVIAVNELSGELGKATFEAMPMLLDISGVVNKVAIYQKYYDEGQLEINRIIAAMRAFNELPMPKDFQQFHLLQQSYDYQVQTQSENSRNLNSYLKQKAELTIKFGLGILPRLSIIIDKQLLVVLRIREEIGINTDKDLLTEQLMKSKFEQQAHLENTMSILKEKLQESISET